MPVWHPDRSLPNIYRPFTNSSINMYASLLTCFSIAYSDGTYCVLHGTVLHNIYTYVGIGKVGGLKYEKYK